MELTSLTIVEAADLIEKRELSPLELTEAHLARIEKLDPQLNCFITLTPEAALESARQAAEAIQKGNYLGPLHAIPLALKDLYETAGVRTTAGSKFFEDHMPAQDCAAWVKLRAAGAVNLGKLNLHEIALGVTNNNPHFGACHPDPSPRAGGSRCSRTGRPPDALHRTLQPDRPAGPFCSVRLHPGWPAHRSANCRQTVGGI